MDHFRGFNKAVIDDFVASATQINRFCWTVGFLGSVSCHHPSSDYPPPQDYFRITFLEDADGVPGAILHKIDPVAVIDKEWIEGTYVWDYATEFDPPLGGFVPGQRYWVRISGRGDFNCTVYTTLSQDGNGLYFADRDIYNETQQISGDVFDWPPWSITRRSGNNLDITFCIGGDASPATYIPPPLTGACCECDGMCTSGITWEDCLGQLCLSADCASSCPPEDPDPPCTVEPLFDRATFHANQDCAEVTCEDLNAIGIPGDSCENPIVAPPHAIGEYVLLPFNTNCATTDGRVTYPNGCYTGDATFENDVWFEYSSLTTGKVQIDLCGLADYDATLAVYTNGTNECPNVDELTGLRTVCPPPLEYLSGDQCFETLCNPTPYTPTTEECSLTNQCYLIRVGGNSDAGTGSLMLRSIYSDCVPPSSAIAEPLEDADGNLVASVKNRVLSFTGGRAGEMEAVRVTFTDLPGAHSTYNGQSLWVGPPVEYDERPSVGYNAPCDPQCQPDDTTCSLCPGETFLSAELQCEPFYTDWSQYGVVHVRDPLIVPSRLAPGGGSMIAPAIYDIHIIHQTCCIRKYSDVGFFNPLSVTSAGWGDIAELHSGKYVAPDQRVTVFDTLAMLQAFGGIPDNGNLLTKVRADLVGVDSGGITAAVDGVITISDLVQVLAAFGGGAFELDPGPWPCP